jgi:uncharacterized protein
MSTMPTAGGSASGFDSGPSSGHDDPVTTPPPPPPPPPGLEPPGGQPASTAYPSAPPGWYAHPGPYAAPPPPIRRPALPAEPEEYHHVLRGPRRAWWRPIVSFLLVIAGVLVASVALVIVAGIGYVVLSGGDLDAFEDMTLDFNNPVTFGVQNLWLAALIPIAGLATWIAHGVRPGFVSSVVGRFRWGWFGWCLLVTVPLWLAYIGVAALIDGDAFADTTGRPSTWVALVVLTLLTTPFQAAGEEYLFRGWLMQQIGAYVKNTYAALAIAIVLSSVVFALAHTSLDPWILIDLGSFATAAVLLTWRTGGLEAAVALHVVNNVIVLILSILTTGLQDAFITPDTTSDPLTTVISFVALVVTSAVIWWLAGRRGVARSTRGASA